MTAKEIEILEKARDIIDEHGLAKHTLYSNGAYCALGAINKANEYTRYTFYYLLTRKYLAKAIAPSNPEYDLNSFNIITNYNDKPTIKKHHVVAKFNKAIELAKAELNDGYLVPSKAPDAKCVYCPRIANYYIVDFKSITSGSYVCVQHVNKLVTEGHPKDHRASEDQSSDAARRKEDL